jgi:hypothetical protein
MSLNGKPVIRDSGFSQPITREELMAVAKALSDGLVEREKVLSERLDRQLYDRMAREPRSITVAPSQPADTSLVELALNSLVTKAVDQAKLLEQGQAALPGLVQELVRGIAEALTSLQLTVHPQVSAPSVTNVVEAPQVFNQVDVPPTVIDLSSLAEVMAGVVDSAQNIVDSLDRQGGNFEKVAQELKLLRSRRVRRTVTRDANGDVESVTEELL